MKAVITVLGKDRVGVLAEVSAICAEHKVNIIDVTQSVMSELFCMIMVCDISGIDCDFGHFAEFIKTKGEEKNLRIRAMHEDIFNSMHNI